MTPSAGLRASLLDRVVEILADAAEGDDASLAQTCRGVLDGLLAAPAPTGHPANSSRPARGEQGGHRVPVPSGEPPAPPAWATHSVCEDGGITHEVVSPRHPATTGAGPYGGDLQLTDVSLSARDVLLDGRWIRTRATVQVEGGSYSLEGARELRDVLDDLLARAEREDSGSDTP